LCQLPVRDRTSLVPILSTILCVLAFITLVIRLVSRRPELTGPFGWDDAIITLAYILAVPVVVFAHIGCPKGLGKDIWMVPFPEIPNILRLFYLCQGFYVSSVNLVKIALLLFLLRVFPNYWFRRLCWLMVGIVALFGTAFTMFSIFQCSPINHVWNQWDGIHEGKCINIYVGSYVNAAINMTLDIVILLMPMPMLIKMNATYSRRRKVHIMIMFSVGIVVTIFSALRVRTLVSFGNLVNPTWDYVDVAIWSMSEMFFGIICCCLPANKVFFMRILPHWIGFTRLGSTAPSGPSNDKLESTSRGTSKFSRKSGKAPRIATAALTNVSEFGDLEDNRDFAPLPEESTDQVPLQTWGHHKSTTAFGTTSRPQNVYQGTWEKGQFNRGGAVVSTRQVS
jgi:hypothetical protein